MAIDVWKLNLAQHLAICGIEQLTIMGYNCIDYTQKSIEKSVYAAKKLAPDSKKMQFRIPPIIECNLELMEGENEETAIPIIYTLERVIGLKDTGWIPGKWETFYQKRQEDAKQDSKKGINPQLFNRHVRKTPEIGGGVFERARQRGENYGLMGILKYGQNTEGMIASRDGLHYTIPLILIGGTDAYDREIMREFSLKYKLPKE